MTTGMAFSRSARETYLPSSGSPDLIHRGDTKDGSNEVDQANGDGSKADDENKTERCQRSFQGIRRSHRGTDRGDKPDDNDYSEDDKAGNTATE